VGSGSGFRAEFHAKTQYNAPPNAAITRTNHSSIRRPNIRSGRRVRRLSGVTFFFLTLTFLVDFAAISSPLARLAHRCPHSISR